MRSIAPRRLALCLAATGVGCDRAATGAVDGPVVGWESAERVVVAVRTSDAAGFTLKLGQLQGAQGAIEWGYEHAKLGKAVAEKVRSMLE